MNNFPLLPSVEPGLRVFVTDEDLADAITGLVGRYAKELAAYGMSASEVEAVETVTEKVRMSVEEGRLRVDVPKPPSTPQRTIRLCARALVMRETRLERQAHSGSRVIPYGVI